MNKKRFMLFIHYLIGVSLICNLGLTLAYLVTDLFSVRFKAFLFISILFYLWNLLSYYKLHSDSVPVITLLLPHILHLVSEHFILKHIDWKAIFILIVLDLLFILIKSYKASAFPFIREEREE